MKEFMNYLNYFVPPIFPALFNRLRGCQFYGDYANWPDAEKDSSEALGSEFLEEIKNLQLKVKNGEAEYTRDFTLFNEPNYNWQLLVALFKAASLNNGNVGVLDFGGSFGNVYYQHRKLLSELKIRWSIVEIPEIVSIGKKEFEDDVLIFYNSITECVKNENINIAILSGVIQVLEKPEQILKELFEEAVQIMVLDRIPIVKDREGSNLLTIQKLSKKMNRARRPYWFFSKNRFLKQFSDYGYNLMAEWQGFDWANIKNSEHKGFLFEKI